MRKIAILVGTVALMTVLCAPLALAIVKECTDRPCYGTKGPDILYERPIEGRGDSIWARGGADVIHAEDYSDDGGIVGGGRSRDRLRVDDGDTKDTAHGSRGFDVCIVDSRGEVGRGCDVVRVR
jgi:hypothetical protein